MKLGTIHNKDHPVMNGVKKFQGQPTSNTVFSPGALNPEGILIASWETGEQLVAEMTKFNGKVIALNFVAPNNAEIGWDANTDGSILILNALFYVSRIPQRWQRD